MTYVSAQVNEVHICSSICHYACNVFPDDLLLLHRKLSGVSIVLVFWQLSQLQNKTV